MKTDDENYAKKYSMFYSFLRAETIINESDIVILMKYFNQSIVQLYQAYKNLFLKAPLYWFSCRSLYIYIYIYIYIHIYILQFIFICFTCTNPDVLNHKN